MKVSLEFEKIPAVGVLFGYDKIAGFIIMLPFFSITIKRIKKKVPQINNLKPNKNQVKQVIDKF